MPLCTRARPKEVYHRFDYAFWFDNLKDNVQKRIRAYLAKAQTETASICPYCSGMDGDIKTAPPGGSKNIVTRSTEGTFP